MVSLIIFIITIMIMILAILFKPSIIIKNINIQTFWLISFIGALIILLSGSIDYSSLFSNIFEGKMNPIKILILFISLSLLSISLDNLGFFSYISEKALEKCKSNQYKIFFILYALISLLTIFTSNDIVILTFTPFIISFSKKAKINPIPYLIVEFVNANTYSMLLSIGNPTNIYLASGFNVSFADYFIHMALPTLLGAIASLCVVLLLFRKSLNKEINYIPNEQKATLKSTPLVIINLIILAITTILLVISNYINFEMWAICLSSAIILSIILFVFSLKLKEKSYILNVYKRLPYNLIPFILSMFILVLALKENGYVNQLSNLLNNMSTNKYSESLTYLIASTLFDNIINNIPMSVLFTSVLEGKSELALYATIAGSNIGAYLTPIGALAGIMWMSILKKNDVDFKFIDFIKYGIILVPTVIVGVFIGFIIIF